MSQIKDFLNNFRDKFCKNKEDCNCKKKAKILGIIGLLLLALLIGYYSYNYISNKFSIPQVMGANFSLEYRKIPFDTKTLEISFSTNLKGESINNKTITLSPFVEGNIELKKGNTLVYNLKKNLEIGQEYSLTINENLESDVGNKIGKPYIIIFEAISGAKVTKIIPEKELLNISQNLTVLFNIPLIPLTSLDNKNSLPCPINISPKINGKCIWTSGNIIEFVPDKYWEGATEYKVIVNSTDGLLYPLKEKKEITFRTPGLNFNVSNSFSPKDGILFNSNYPIDRNDVEKSLIITENNNKILTKLVAEKGSETRFFIKPVNGEFNYSKTYNLSIPAGISPKYGNIPSKTQTGLNITSTNFVTSIEPYMNVYSETGAISDNISFAGKNVIPDKNVFFKFSFDEEVGLDKGLFEFSSENKKTIPFDIKYGAEQIWDGHGNYKEKESKKMLILTLKENLDTDSIYSLKILKKANPNLSKDEIHIFNTPKKFVLTDFDYVDNSLACVYFSNDLFAQSQDGDYYDYMYGQKKDTNQTIINISPKAIIRSIARDRQDYNTQKYTCPQKEGKMSYLLNFRLDPFRDYTVTIPKGLKDNYNNNLDKDYTYKIKSGDIKESDKYIYSSFNKDINVIPKDAPAIINIQSINLTKANIEICEMDAIGYNDYILNSYADGFSPKCIKNTNKEVVLKNKNWLLSHNKFDIEKDIVGSTIESPIYLIRTKLSGKNYITDGKSFGHIIVKTNLSLAYEESKNKHLIFATSLDGKETPNNLIFEGYNTVGNTVTNQGIVKAKWVENKKIYELPNSYDTIVAKNDKYFGIVNKGSDQTSNYDFKYIAGQDSTTKDFLYLYTERPIYRPGDTVFFKGILREFSFDGYHKSKVTKGVLKILDENYVFFKDVKIDLDKNSNFSGKFELPKDMALGKYSFEFYPEGSQESTYNDAKFFVEEYKKPVFKINIDGDKKDAQLGDKVNIKFNTEYYFGGRMGGAHYYKSVISQNYFFDAKDYSDYQFGDSGDNFNCNYWGYCSYDDNTEFSSEGTMKPEGEENWNYEFKKDGTGEKIYSFNVTAEDPNTKKQVSNTYNVVLHNTDAYVGINTPYYNELTSGIKLNGIVLNHSAQPLSDKNVKIDLIKRDWKEAKKQGVDGIFYNDYSVEEKLEGTFSMTSGSNGEFGDTLIPKLEGEYQIKATYTGENGKTFMSSTSVYVAGKESFYWGVGNNTTTDLIADKSILKIGDIAKFTLKSPVTSGKMLVTIEKDDGILDYFTQDIKSSGDRISVPIKNNYYPNIYVKVFLIGKDSNNPLPIYKRALSVIKVMTDDKKIKISIKPDKNRYLPGEKITLNIKTTDESGKPIANVNGSIGIVDESLLALKGNPKKNPFAFFYDMKRYLGVETYLSLFNLVEKLDIKDISDGEKGGAGEGAKGGDSKKKRGVFKDTAFWQADYITDTNGEFKITTEPLPDNLTTWVIESVGSTGDDTKIGVGETTITTTKKVLINENTPRFVGSNDMITISPVVFNKTGKNSTFIVTLKGNNITVDNYIQEVKINNGSQKNVDFKVKVADLNAIKEISNINVKVDIKAIAKETNDEDEVERFLPIVETSVKESTATVGNTSDISHTEKIDLNNIVINTAKVVINYASSLLGNVTSGIEFLTNFTYTCMEQNQSAIMPEIYLKNLYNNIGIPYDLTKQKVKVWIDSYEGYKEITKDELIKNYIAESPRYQKTSGGFGYWSDENSFSHANFDLTSIVVEGISEIKKLSYNINEKSLNDAVDYLKKRFYENKIEGCIGNINECKYSEESRLSAINAMLSYSPNDYETYKMFKLIDMKNVEISAKITSISIIGKLLNNKNITVGEKSKLKQEGIDIANKIIQEYIVYNPRGAFIGKDTYNSRILNTANFIGAVSDLGLDNFKDIEQIIDNMNRWIASQKKDGSFGSTQETVKVIENVAKYMGATNELKDVKLNVKLNLNGKSLDEKNIDKNNKLETFKKIINGNDLKVQNDFTINKEGVGKIFYDIVLSYFLPIEKVMPRNEGFFLEQNYYDYNEYSKIKSLKDKEYAEYLSGTIDYSDLRYPKDVIEYLVPANNYKVGQIILTHNRIITGEPRDQVAFEGFIPAGSELVNTSLSTENQALKTTKVFDREELRDDRFFGYKDHFDAGIFSFDYIIRITHDGSFNLKPSQISEFYNTEVFGRNKGRVIEVNN